jgi:hypothetical protein
MKTVERFGVLMNYDRIILELMDRVSALEDEVKQLRQGNATPVAEETVQDTIPTQGFSSGRDTTKYILDGKKYAKNRLVLAIIQKYVSMHPGISAAELIGAFDKSLQGSLGVVRTLDDVERNCSDFKTRFFANSDELIQTRTQPCAVCTQWGIANIGNIIARAEQLGIEVTAVK